MSTILITGGTGMIGTALSRMVITKGHRVILLSRNVTRPAPVSDPSVSTAHWDPYKDSIDPEAIKAADFIIHLAGAGVGDKRWSARRKKEIVESRTRSSALLVKALKEIPNNVQAVVSASGRERVKNPLRTADTTTTVTLAPSFGFGSSEICLSAINSRR